MSSGIAAGRRAERIFDAIRSDLPVNAYAAEVLGSPFPGGSSANRKLRASDRIGPRKSPFIHPLCRPEDDNSAL
jgi:hypothetical protein